MLLNGLKYINYAMKDTGSIGINILRYMLQIFVSLMIMLKVIVPVFANGDAFLISLVLVPILFFSIGIVFNKTYEFYTTHKQ